MKIILITSLTFLFFSSCKKEKAVAMEMMAVPIDTSAVLKYKADFIGSTDVITTGTSEVYLRNRNYFVKFLNFKTSAGPDLHVLLSKEEMPVTYIDLGTLTLIKGDQEYNIPGEPNFAEYKYICIHCIKYNHLFGTAKIN